MNKLKLNEMKNTKYHTGGKNQNIHSINILSFVWGLVSIHLS